MLVLYAARVHSNIYNNNNNNIPDGLQGRHLPHRSTASGSCINYTLYNGYVDGRDELSLDRSIYFQSFYLCRNSRSMYSRSIATRKWNPGEVCSLMT